MTTITVTEAKSHFLELVRDTDDRFGRYVITKNGKAACVMMNADEFDGWLETIEIMSDKDVLREIRRSRAELSAGKVKSFEYVVGRAQRRKA